MKVQIDGLVPYGIREKYIQERINESGMSRAGVAECAGISPSTLNSMLRRGIAGSAIDTVVRICDILDIDVNTFVRGVFRDSDDLYIQKVNMSNRLFQTRVKLRYRLNAVSSFLGVTESAYRDMEGGVRLILDEHIKQLSGLFKVSEEYLYCRAEATSELNSKVCEPSFDHNNAAYNYGLGIRQLRERVQMSRSDFAEHINQSVELLADWEDDIRVPTTFDIANIATIFSVLPGTLCPERSQYADAAEADAIVNGYKKASDRDQQLVRLILGLDESVSK